MKNNETKVTEEIKTEVTEEVVRDSRASEDRNATANEVVWTPGQVDVRIFHVHACMIVLRLLTVACGA